MEVELTSQGDSISESHLDSDIVMVSYLILAQITMSMRGIHGVHAGKLLQLSSTINCLVFLTETNIKKQSDGIRYGKAYAL